MSLFADQSREQMRATYRNVWRKWREGSLLQPLEAQIAEVILAHPEYHAALQDPTSVQQEFPLDSAGGNPFLHMGLHLALREQIGTDRPAGIAAVHARLAAASSGHGAEHRMLEVLTGVLSEAQQRGAPPPEAAYLDRLRRL